MKMKRNLKLRLVNKNKRNRVKAENLKTKMKWARLQVCHKKRLRTEGQINTNSSRLVSSRHQNKNKRFRWRSSILMVVRSWEPSNKKKQTRKEDPYKGRLHLNRLTRMESSFWTLNNLFERVQTEHLLMSMTQQCHIVMKKTKRAKKKMLTLTQMKMRTRSITNLTRSRTIT